MWTPCATSTVKYCKNERDSFCFRLSFLAVMKLAVTWRTGPGVYLYRALDRLVRISFRTRSTVWSFRNLINARRLYGLSKKESVLPIWLLSGLTFSQSRLTESLGVLKKCEKSLLRLSKRASIRTKLPKRNPTSIFLPPWSIIPSIWTVGKVWNLS